MTSSQERFVVDRLRRAGCVFAEDEAALLRTEATGDDLGRMVDRRVAGEPLEQVLGWAQFAGLRVYVAPRVFVPRRRTEFLAEQAISRTPRVLVDLCCGTGAVAAAVRSALPSAEVYATDIDPIAVRCARRNLPPSVVFEGDLFASLPDRLRGRIDVVAANAPYVPSSEVELMPREARLYEALVALDGGPDGLDLHRRIIDEARGWVAPEGSLLIETSSAQADADLAACAAFGWHAEVLRSDELDATVVAARRS